MCAANKAAVKEELERALYLVELADLPLEIRILEER